MAPLFPRPYSIIVPGRCHMLQRPWSRASALLTWAGLKAWPTRPGKALARALPLLLGLPLLQLALPLEAQSPRPLVLSAVVDALIQPVSADR